MNRITSFVRTAAVAAMFAGAVGVAAIGVDPAGAAGRSNVSTGVEGGWVAVYNAPHTDTNPDHWVPNGTPFAMNCWLDNQGMRWFFGQIDDTGGWVYVREDQTFDQVTVGAC